MNSKWWFNGLVAGLFVTAVFALFSVNRRHRVEIENRTTALAVEYETVESLASAQGISVSKALTDLKAQGVSAVVLSESYLGDLISSGRATLVSVSPGNGIPSSSGLMFNDRRQLARVQRGLRVQFHDLAGNLVPRGNVLSLPAVAPLILRQTAIGLDPDQIETVKSLQLEIIGRCTNPVGVSPQSVKETLAWLRQSGADVFLPSGDQVLGRRDSLDATNAAMLALGLRYASPEFTKIAGDEEILRVEPQNVIRLHTAQTAELDRLDYAGAVDRFVKAARERNMRILLIRPFTQSADQPLAEFAHFIKDIGDGLRTRGIPLGHPKCFMDPMVPSVVFLALGISAAICCGFAAIDIFPDRKVWLPIVVLLGLLGIACWLKIGRQVMALIISGAFPVLGFLLMDRMAPPMALPKALRPLPGFLIISLLSLLGGLCVAGLLNGLPYLVKADEFRGIKISIFLPILIVGGVFVYRLMDWRRALANPVTWGTAALGVMVLAALAFMLARTGNDSAVGASGGELELRGFLDAALFVRPRTKEFLVGHPILYVGIGLLMMLPRPSRTEASETEASETESSETALRGSEPRRSEKPLAAWIVLALMVGAIGQTSAVNTLCHLHIPVILSVVRILLGVFLGSIIGVGLWLAVARFVAPSTE